MPTLDSVIALASAHHVAVIAELKDPATSSTDLTAFPTSIGHASSPVLVESFFPDLLQDTAARSPSTPLALITSTVVPATTALMYGHVLIVSEAAATAAALTAWHAAGLKVYAYTPDTSLEWHAMRDAGWTP